MYKYLLKRVHQTYQEYMVCWIRENLRKGAVVYLKSGSPNKLWKVAKKFKPEV